MELSLLKEKVFKANLDLVKHGWLFYLGQRECHRQGKRTVVIKPSGVAYEDMKVEDMVVLDLNGQKV
jgi:L-ribulose-5-phosphate 4-epimerase